LIDKALLLNRPIRQECGRERALATQFPSIPTLS